MKRFYLQQVNIIIKAAQGSTEDGMEENAQQKRIRQQVQILAQSLGEYFVVNVSSEQDEVEEWTDEEEILWLTDSPQVAGKLTEKQLPVMAWLHEGNRYHGFEGIRYAVEEPQDLDADFFEKIYRRFKKIPWEIAVTKRCVIRETTAEDVDSFVEIYSQPEITKYTDDFCMEPQKEREHVKEYIEKVYDFFGFGIWTVLWRETDEVIGRVGFEQPFVCEGENRGEEAEELLALGYMIAAPWQGKGIAQEVCLAALAFANKELDVSKVQVVINAENQPSLRLAEKLGFGDWQDVTLKGVKCKRGVTDSAASNKRDMIQ